MPVSPPSSGQVDGSATRALSCERHQVGRRLHDRGESGDAGDVVRDRGRHGALGRELRREDAVGSTHGLDGRGERVRDLRRRAAHVQHESGLAQVADVESEAGEVVAHRVDRRRPTRRSRCANCSGVRKWWIVRSTRYSRGSRCSSRVRRWLRGASVTSKVVVIVVWTMVTLAGTGATPATTTRGWAASGAGGG